MSIIKQRQLTKLPVNKYFEAIMKSEKQVPVEVYSRVVGYYRPVNQWNKGKQEEFYDRNEFSPKEMMASIHGNQRDTKDIAC
jgi:hypothetical protein